MSRQRRNPFVEDMWVAVHAELHELDGSHPGQRFASGERTHPYDAPVRYPAPRLIRCRYPRCVHEIAARCSTCKRLYCAEHCHNAVLWSRDTRHECALCVQHSPRDSLDSNRDHGTLVGIGAMILFLLTVSVGIAVDILGTRGWPHRPLGLCWGLLCLIALHGAQSRGDIIRTR
jgi:hypothetical protein